MSEIERFLEAQENDYDKALKEIKREIIIEIYCLK